MNKIIAIIAVIIVIVVAAFFLVPGPEPEPNPPEGGGEVTITYTSTTGGSISNSEDVFDPSLDSPTGSIANPAPGYVFEGWMTSDETLVTKENNLVPEYDDASVSNIKYIALFLPESQPSVTIVYASQQGGTVSLSSETVKESGLVTGSYAIANPGYEFVCWKNSSDEFVTAESSIKPQKVEGKYVGETYIAYFEETGNRSVVISYTIRGFGSVSIQGETIPYGHSAIGCTAKADDGYEFVKWVCTSNESFVYTGATFIPSKVNGVSHIEDP